MTRRQRGTKRSTEEGFARVAVIDATDSFYVCLQDIERKLVQVGSVGAYLNLLELIRDELKPTLSRFPAMGRPLARFKEQGIRAAAMAEVESVETRAAAMGLEARTIQIASWSVLYVHSIRELRLVAIRHQRQERFGPIYLR